MRVERLETRQLMAADSIGVTPSDNGEFLIGRVAVTPVLFESNGQTDTPTQDWTADEIQETLDKVADGVQWWVDTLATLNTVHSLEFVIDDTFAVDPVDTPYEPIDRTSADINLYSGDFLTTQGYGDASTIEEAVHAFNNDQRIKHAADWAFTLFIIDSSDDPDGLFAAGGAFAAAYSLPGGLFIVTPSTRPASTISHEIGHIFWARDEYAGGGSWTDTRGYYNQQNLNAADNPTAGFVQQVSIMRGGVPLGEAYLNHVSPDSTLAFVGWRDSDNDGVFDFADVPLALDGSGDFDADTSTYHFVGDASAVALRNLNSSGNQSDITLNEINVLEYRLDEVGLWQTVTQYQSQSVSIDETFSITTPFQQIELRVRDVTTGVTSPPVTGTRQSPALSASSVQGFAFYDEDADGNRGQAESIFSDYSVEITQADGSPLVPTGTTASDFPEGELSSESIDGISLSSDGIVSDTKVGIFESATFSEKVFHSFDLQRQQWTARWDRKVSLVASLDAPTGTVELQLGGLDDGSYGRVVGYDASGNEITRVTSDLIANGQWKTVTLEDPLGKLSRVEVFGHADTSVTVGEIQVGLSGTLPLTIGSGWTLKNLPDGDYGLKLTTDLVIYQFASVPSTLTVTDGTRDPLSLAVQRVDSPRHNSTLPEDVNQDSVISSIDALLIINDIGRLDTRVLGHDETNGFKIDVNNDGSVSALDALLIINRLGQQNAEGEAPPSSEQEAGKFVVPAFAGMQRIKRPPYGTIWPNDPAANTTSESFTLPAQSRAGRTFAIDDVLQRWTNDDSGMLDLAGYDLPPERITPVATDRPEVETANSLDKSPLHGKISLEILNSELPHGKNSTLMGHLIQHNR